MDHGVWHQARDAAGRLYFFNDAGETRWDWPGGEAAPLAVQNAFAGALQQPVVAGGNAPAKAFCTANGAASPPGQSQRVSPASLKK